MYYILATVGFLIILALNIIKKTKYSFQYINIIEKIVYLVIIIFLFMGFYL